MIRRMDHAKILGDRLRAARLARGMSLGQLQARTGINFATISKFESAVLSPSVAKLRVLCAALSVSADYLLGLTDDPAPRRSSSSG